MVPVDPTIDETPAAVERGEDVRPIPDPIADNGLVLDLDSLVCTGLLPPGTCLATEHLDRSVCRPDDMCWVLEPDLHHVNHQCPCWHEVMGTANGATPYIQPLIVDGSPVEPAAVEGDELRGEDPDPSPAPVDPFAELRDAIYAALVAEGNPPELSIVLASIYAMIVPSQIPETMALLRNVGDSISGVLGDGGGGGLMGKILGRAMKGNAG